jgi:hypothetical protein
VLRVALGRTYLRGLRCPVPLGMARMCTSVMTARAKALKFCPFDIRAHVLTRWRAGDQALAHVHAHASAGTPTQNARHVLYKEDKCSNRPHTGDHAMFGSGGGGDCPPTTLTDPT